MVAIAHDLLRAYADKGGAAADFTLGQGYDCELLMGLDAIERVYAFDVQDQAVACARAYLQDKRGFAKVRLILDGHEHAERYIQEPLRLAVFNFGYFPKGDPAITTQAKTSLRAVQCAAKLLAPKGLLVMAVYPGHAAGKEESAVLDAWARELPSSVYDCMRISMCNKQDCPYILAVEKKRCG